MASPALQRYYTAISGEARSLLKIAERAHAGTDPAAETTMQRLFSYFGRALSVVVNIIDPDVIIIRGGVGSINRLYTEGVARVATCSTTYLKRLWSSQLWAKARAFLEPHTLLPE